ncbi:MAG: hypothetical protein QNJ65_04410 [Xenococcaceae cyanobacterium MO_234.B1]|nr:hypothetical protein [Xenococcaceae cyanobacterium MO_234.B1]
MVDPRYTSKTCNCCKVIGNSYRKNFRRFLHGAG